MRNRSVRSASSAETNAGKKSWFIFFGGLISGLLIAVVVALYVTHAPVPALTESVRSTPDYLPEPDKATQNKADNDKSAQTEDPNVPLHPSASTNAGDLPQSIDALAQRETPEIAETSPAGGPVAGTKGRAGYVLQIGAYTTAEEAERQKANLAMQGYETVISSYETNKVLYYRLRIGPFSNIQDAEQMKTKLASAKINSLLIKVEN